MLDDLQLQIDIVVGMCNEICFTYTFSRKSMKDFPVFNVD